MEAADLLLQFAAIACTHNQKPQASDNPRKVSPLFQPKQKIKTPQRVGPLLLLGNPIFQDQQKNQNLPEKKQKQQNQTLHKEKRK